MEAFLWVGRTDGALERPQRLLSQAEQERADGFRRESDRRRFAAARATLRLVLGLHLDVEPTQLHFGEGGGSKPTLLTPDAPVQFNLARSADLVLCGVTARHRIGVDLEHIRAIPDLEEVAKRVMSSSEFAQWGRGNQQQRLDSFYRIWSRKEALVKAEGKGLALGLETITVPLDLGGQQTSHIAGTVAGPTGTWCISDLQVGNEDYAACVAIEHTTSSSYVDSTWDAGSVVAEHPSLRVPEHCSLTIRRFGSFH